MVDRRQHLGPETTATFWMGRVVNHIRTIKDSAMVMLVAGYVAETSVEDIHGDEDLDPEDKLELILKAEDSAFNEYMRILEDWASGDKQLAKAARLSSMLAEANYLSIRSIEDAGDESEYLEYAVECAKEYSVLVKTAASMLAKTTAWSAKHEADDEDLEDEQL